MWRNLVVATALLVGGLCSEALCAKDGGFTGSETGAVHSSATAESDDSTEGLLSGETSSSEPATPVDSGPRARGLGARRTDELRTTGLRRLQPQLSDFAGLWRGEAVDYPEDGTSTDPVGIKLTISESGKLEGVAFDDFAGGDETPLEDVYVAADRLEFKVRYRTGVQMRVTLGLAGDTLKGEGIPIRSDSDRCHIVLHRRRPETPSREGEPSESQLSGFVGQWRGRAVDRPEDGSSRDAIGISLALSDSGRLEGVAFDDFAGGDETPLEDVYVAGDRIEFKVRHRTGVQMRVTLGLTGSKLKGEGIPIRSDEDRCDIVLERSEQRDQHRGTPSDGESACLYGAQNLLCMGQFGETASFRRET